MYPQSVQVNIIGLDSSQSTSKSGPIMAIGFSLVKFRRPFRATAAFVTLYQIFSTVAAQSCSEDHRSIYGMMLKRHAFDKTKVKNWYQCMKACNDDFRCQSVNYGISEGMCELNKRTKEARPEDFVPASHVAYMTRFSKRVPLGSFPELPAESCTEIKSSEGEDAVSGNYWLDPTNTGASTQVYCVLDLEECISYQALTDGGRKNTAGGAIECDSSLGPGWFRFLGDAGTKMPTSCVPAYRCGTHAPGWLNGAHPTVTEGKVTRQVCFNWGNNCCTWTINIQVRNCGDFFVYYFKGTPPEHSCNLRYCGAD
ncbi:uncharacterized protein LOC144665329 isoform X1 [Oculina patagonica]